MAYKSLPVLNVPFGRPSGSVNTSPLIHELKQRAAVQSRTEASRSKSSVQTTKPTPLSPSLALSGFFNRHLFFLLYQNPFLTLLVNSYLVLFTHPPP